MTSATVGTVLARFEALPVEAKGRAPGPSGSNETAACYP